MIALTSYSHAADFLSRTQTALEQTESANNLMLGLSLRLASQPRDLTNPPHFLTVDEGENLRLAGVMTPPRRLILVGWGEVEEAALEAVAREMQRRRIGVSGVTGAAALSDRFAKTWSQVTGEVVHAGLRTRIYELRRVEYWPSVAGQFRVARAEDTEVLAGWFHAFEEEALGEVTPTEEMHASVTAKIEAGDLFVWEDGAVVSMAGRTRPTAHGITVGPVYTPPDVRGRGYASAVVGHLSQHLLDAGYQYCCLFTDLANPTSNSIYQRLGYGPVCDYNEYIFGQSTEFIRWIRD